MSPPLLESPSALDIVVAELSGRGLDNEDNRIKLATALVNGDVPAIRELLGIS